MNLTLYRYSHSPQRVLGLLLCEGIYVGDTLELPWKDNTHLISCIPEGIYKGVYFKSPSHGGCLRLLDVPNRDNVEVHVANYVHELKGCIALGIKSDDTLIKSQITVDKLVALITHRDAILEVKKL